MDHHVGEKSGSRIELHWNSDPYAKEYEVEVATNDTFSFNSTIESRRTYETSWAPDINLTLPANQGTLFWRVAAVEQGGNVGPTYATGSFAPRKPKCVVKRVKKKKKTVKKCVAPKPATKKPNRKHG